MMRERDVTVHVTRREETNDRPLSIRVRLVHKPTGVEGAAEAPTYDEAREEARKGLEKAYIDREARRLRAV